MIGITSYGGYIPKPLDGARVHFTSLRPRVAGEPALLRRGHEAPEETRLREARQTLLSAQ